MSGVTGSTGDSVLVVYRAIEILVLEIILVARHATLGDLCGGLLREAEDLRLIPTAINVSRTRPVARFASMPFLPASCGRKDFVMRRTLNILKLVFVTRLAIVGTDVLRGIP